MSKIFVNIPIWYDSLSLSQNHKKKWYLDLNNTKIEYFSKSRKSLILQDKCIDRPNRCVYKSMI